MASSLKTDLFTQEETKWEKFHRTVRDFHPSPVDGWRWLYGKWKTNYQSFRDLEKKSLYSVDEAGKASKADDGEMQAHRESISYLIWSGEMLSHQLDQISTVFDSKEEKEEAHTMKIAIGTLLESLRESMEIWHPANKTECPDTLKNIFGD